MLESNVSSFLIDNFDNLRIWIVVLSSCELIQVSHTRLKRADEFSANIIWFLAISEFLESGARTHVRVAN